MLVGLSQGGLYARYLLERCEVGKHVTRLMTIGTPNEGIKKIPLIKNEHMEKIVNAVVNNPVTSPIQRRKIIQQNYFNDSAFINELNNKDQGTEEHMYEQKKERMMLLQGIVLVSFRLDEIVKPVNTQFFGLKCEQDDIVKKEGKPCIIANPENSLEDNLGLNQLSQSKRLTILQVNQQHLQFNEDDMARVAFFFHHNTNF